MAGWWKAPRQLARMLATRELTLTEYVLLHYLAESGADRVDGLATSNRALAEAVGVNERTIRRALRSLRADGLIAFDDHERIAVFTIRTADTLRTLLESPESARMSAPVSAGSADTTVPATASNTGQENENAADTVADSRARARDTETETERAAAAEEGNDELARLVAPLERADGYPLNGVGRRDVERAFAELPNAVTALIDRYLQRRRAGQVESGVGALVKAVRRGEHREHAALAATTQARRAVCPECGVGGGVHVIDCPTLKGSA